MGLVSWLSEDPDAHKELILSLLFFVLEAVSVVLDQIGKNEVGILLVAFLLSAFGFAITLYSIIKARRNEPIREKIQLKAVDIVFSVIQLIVAFIHYLLTVLQVKNDYNASVFPLAFAIISVVFSFKKGRQIQTGLPIKNPNPTELDQIGTSTNQVNHARSSTTVKRHIHAGKQIDGSSTTAPHLGSTPIEEPAESSTTAPLLGSTPNEEPESSPTDSPLGSTPIEPDSSTIDSLLGSTPIEPDSSTTDSPIENLQPIGSTTSIPIELDQIQTSTNQVNPARSSIVRRRTHAHKQINTTIFSKHLTQYEIDSKLSIPASALEHIALPESLHFVDLSVRDSAGLTWTFRLYTRPAGHPKPCFTKGWLAFVRAKGLQIGDLFTFGTTQEDEDGAQQFTILVQREVTLMGKRITVDL